MHNDRVLRTEKSMVGGYKPNERGREEREGEREGVCVSPLRYMYYMTSCVVPYVVPYERSREGGRWQ